MPLKSLKGSFCAEKRTFFYVLWKHLVVLSVLPGVMDFREHVHGGAKRYHGTLFLEDGNKFLVQKWSTVTMVMTQY